jgi:hypothetical protein
MPNVPPPQWTLHARKFIATGKQEFLDRAIANGTDPAVVALLRAASTTPMIPADQYQPLVEQLRAAQQRMEAAVVELIMLRPLASMVENAERLEPQEREFAFSVCAHAALTSHQNGFPECEATFAAALGTGNAKSGHRDDARRLYEHALAIYRDLAQSEPHIYGPYVATTLNNLGNMLEAMGNDVAAFGVSREAVEAAEWHGTDARHLWLAKGMASAAYRRVLRRTVQAGDHDLILRCLAAMREGSVRALGEDSSESLASAAQALHELSGRIGRRVSILAVEPISENEVLLAVLGGESDAAMDYHVATGLAPAAAALFAEIDSIFDKDDHRPAEVRNPLIETLAEEAWEALPQAVQAVLHPRYEADLLISAGPQWAAFPWEALRFGEGQDDWLGLHRTLARWGPLTAAGLARLGRRGFGNGAALRAAVVCPLDAAPDDSEKDKAAIQKALRQVERLESHLNVQNYRLVPNGEALIGADANPAQLNEVLGDGAAIIHYLGHGTVVQSEEALVLHCGRRHVRPWSYYGRRELDALRVRLGRDRLLEHGPLITLTACHTGRSRSFGGRREDLAWTFLSEGAEAVIASALPVKLGIGLALGESIYQPWRGGAEGLGRGLVCTRRLMARAFRDRPDWATWTLLAYHGNPYAMLPPGAAGNGDEWLTSMSGQIAGTFNLDSKQINALAKDIEQHSILAG